MTKDENLSDHDLLIRLDAKMDSVINSYSDLKRGMYGDDGQGGLCGRISKIEQFQSTLLGIAASISFVVSLAGSWILSKLEILR